MEATRPIQLKTLPILFRWYQKLFRVRQTEPMSNDDSIPADKAIVVTKNAHSDSVLAQLIRDEDFIIRLIKEDILISAFLKKIGVNKSEHFLTKDLELHLVIYDLLLLDRSANKEKAIDRYNQLIEDNIKMLLEFPTLSVYAMAASCYLEIRKVRQWQSLNSKK
jgi:phosphate uptake regulator